jgi:large subunit ribosomal protein L6
MSKIGKQPIQIPEDTSISVMDDKITVKGHKGNLCVFVKYVIIKIEKNCIHVKLKANDSKYKKFHGLYRSLINNAIIGVSSGFNKTLVIKGTGYKVKKQDKHLIFNLGFSHPIEKTIPDSLSINITKQGQQIDISGIDKNIVGLFAAKLRNLKKPEPYLGKGIRYIDEKISYKLGKTKTK